VERTRVFAEQYLACIRCLNVSFKTIFFLGTDEEKEQKKDQYKMYLKLMQRDTRRFKAADLNSDGKLSKIGELFFVNFGLV
jgi:hypothetical protein